MDQGRIAPSPTDSEGSGTISSGSISICEPSPVQRGQAPWGELNENTRGSSSARPGPCSGQANFSEKVIVWPSSTSSMSTSPSASATAVSTESARRLRRSGRMTSRSTTTEMSCLYFLSSSIGSSSWRTSPSTFTRVNPSPRSSSSSFPYSPLRPRTTGASTMKRVPSSSVITWSMICSADCPSIGRPQMWQCGLPIRAHSRRR